MRIEPLILCTNSNLCEYNVGAIREICSRLGLKTPLVMQSQMTGPEVFGGKGSARLAAICGELGGDTYLAGDGSDEYEDIALYASRGITFTRSGFQMRAYPQPAEQFVGGLSVLDALFNVGPEETAKLLLAPKACLRES